jgi:hypothetical protein
VTRLFVVLCAALLLPPSARAAEPQTRTVAGFDSAALKRAIEESQPGETVQLPEGTYTITEPILPKSGTHLLGAGQEKTLVHFAGAKPAVMVSLNDREDLEVAHLTLDGQNNPKVAQGLAAGNARRLKLHHLTIRNLAKSETFGPHGMLFSGTNPKRERGVTDSEVSDCLIENIAPDASFGCGMRFSWGSSRNRILRNTIRHTGRGGIFGDNGSTDLLIRGNTVLESGGEGLGIEVWERCDRSVIEENTMDHWLSNGGSDYCAIRRNRIGDKSGVVKFIGIEGIGARSVYTDNVVDGGQQIGLSVSNVAPKDDGYWAYNTVANCVQWGAQFQGERNGLVRHYFYRCKFTRTSPARGKPAYPGDAGHGFRMNGNMRRCVFEECDFSENDGLGLQFGGADLDAFTFLNCNFRNNKGAAVAGLKEYTALEWTRCVVEGNKSDELRPAKPFPQPAPTAAFEVPEKARVGEAVRFVSAARAAQGQLAATLWDFGDGPPVSEPAAAHTYARAGEYRVTLIVWDEAGRGARAEKLLRVSE